MTLIDLAALLAKYSFSPNLSLSWLLWLLISQLQKPPRMQRDFNALPLSSLSLSLYILCLLFFPSLVPAHLAVSLSHFHTFPLIWQQSEPCRWRSFQRISRKLIYFCKKYDPTQANTFVHFKMYKTGSGFGATSSSAPHTRAVIPCLSNTLVNHIHTFSSQSLWFQPCYCVGGGQQVQLLICNNMRPGVCVCNCAPSLLHNRLAERRGPIRRAALQSCADWPAGHHW